MASININKEVDQLIWCLQMSFFPKDSSTLIGQMLDMFLKDHYPAPIKQGHSLWGAVKCWKIGRHGIPGPVGGMWSSGLVDKSHHYVIYQSHIPHTLSGWFTLVKNAVLHSSSQKEYFWQFKSVLPTFESDTYHYKHLATNKPVYNYFVSIAYLEVMKKKQDFAGFRCGPVLPHWSCACPGGHSLSREVN